MIARAEALSTEMGAGKAPVVKIGGTREEVGHALRQCRSVATLACLCVLLVACDRRPPSQHPAQTWSVAEPEITIVPPPRDTELLAATVGAARTHAGGLALGNHVTGQVDFYDASGTLVRTISQRTGLPVDSTDLRWVGRCPGSGAIGAWDIRTRGFTFFSDSGDVQGTFTLAPRLLYVHLLACLSDGTLLAFQDQPWDIPDGRGATRLPAELIRIDRGGLRADTLQSFSGTDFYFSRTIPAYTEQPLGRKAWATFANGVALIGSSDQAFVQIVDTLGKRKRRIVTDLSSRPVRFADVMADAKVRLTTEPAADVRSLLRELISEAPVSSTLPRYADFRADADGNLWLKTYELQDTTRVRWRVYDFSGHYLALCDVPVNLQVLELGHDYVLGLERAPTKAVRVVLRRLLKPSQ